jgi:hypothetical protein
MRLKRAKREKLDVPKMRVPGFPICADCLTLVERCAMCDAKDNYCPVCRKCHACGRHR